MTFKVAMLYTPKESLIDDLLEYGELEVAQALVPLTEEELEPIYKRAMHYAEQQGTPSGAGILAHDDRQYCYVDCPEWGTTIRLRSLTALEFGTLQKAIGDQMEVGISEALERMAVNEEGELLFEKGDGKKLQGKSLRALMRFQDPILELNGMSASTEGGEEKND